MDIIEAETTFGRWFKMILLCLLAFTGIGILPLLWIGYKRMQNMPEDDPNCIFLRKLLICGLIFIVAGFGYLIWKLMPDYAEHKEHVSWLPTVATDISYYRKAFECELYEFRITEADFRSLYHRQEFEEIKEPVTVTRCLKMFPAIQENEFTVTVKHGLHISRIISTVSGQYRYSVTFDRDHGRAYVTSLPAADEGKPQD